MHKAHAEENMLQLGGNYILLYPHFGRFPSIVILLLFLFYNYFCLLNINNMKNEYNFQRKHYNVGKYYEIY